VPIVAAHRVPAKARRLYPVNRFLKARLPSTKSYDF
jgi:hypothetical protein